MEQKDYLLREIEKIGLVLKMIFNKIISKSENNAITIGNRFEEAKELILHEIGFNMDLFLSLNTSETETYLSKFKGFNSSNIELLADILNEAGMKTENKMSRKYLEHALNLYELCNSTDKTFSFEREHKISEIRNSL